jgi:hypothetical protein
MPFEHTMSICFIAYHLQRCHGCSKRLFPWPAHHRNVPESRNVQIFTSALNLVQMHDQGTQRLCATTNVYSESLTTQLRRRRTRIHVGHNI